MTASSLEATATRSQRFAALAREYLELTKPKVVALLVFTALVGMFLAVPGLPPLRESVFGFIGIWLAAASAAAINHLIDQRIDRVMARTAGWAAPPWQRSSSRCAWWCRARARPPSPASTSGSAWA